MLRESPAPRGRRHRGHRRRAHLGIGDQGAGGLGIPIGKLSLYTLIGGIHPARTLPIVLDVGTNNAERLNDPEYLGWRHERVTGQAYFDFIDQFVQAVQQELPDSACSGRTSRPRTRAHPGALPGQLLTFNDDIQGTAAVALGAILGRRRRDRQAAARPADRVPRRRFGRHRRGRLPAGGAGRRTASRKAEARSRFWIVDKDGLLHAGRTDLTPEQRVYAQPADCVADWPRTGQRAVGLADVIGTGSTRPS